MTKPRDFDKYISRFPTDIQKHLQQIRKTVKKIASEATETISYGLPAFNLNGKYLIYFAAYKNHIGLYPVPNGGKELNKEFAPYSTSGKGTVQFPIDNPMPIELITKIVRFRIKDNIVKAKKNKKKIKRMSS